MNNLEGNGNRGTYVIMIGWNKDRRIWGPGCYYQNIPNKVHSMDGL